MFVITFSPVSWLFGFKSGRITRAMWVLQTSVSGRSAVISVMWQVRGATGLSQRFVSVISIFFLVFEEVCVTIAVFMLIRADDGPNPSDVAASPFGRRTHFGKFRSGVAFGLTGSSFGRWRVRLSCHCVFSSAVVIAAVSHCHRNSRGARSLVQRDFHRICSAASYLPVRSPRVAPFPFWPVTQLPNWNRRAPGGWHVIPPDGGHTYPRLATLREVNCCAFMVVNVKLPAELIYARIGSRGLRLNPHKLRVAPNVRL